MLRRVEIRSVIKVSLAFTFLAALLAAGIATGLYEAGRVFGIVHGVDRVAVRVFNAHKFHLRMPEVVGGATALAGVLGLLATAVAAIAAWMFNLISNLTGGFGVRLTRVFPPGGPQDPPG